MTAPTATVTAAITATCDAGSIISAGYPRPLASLRASFLPRRIDETTTGGLGAWERARDAQLPTTSVLPGYPWRSSARWSGTWPPGRCGLRALSAPLPSAAPPAPAVPQSLNQTRKLPGQGARWSSRTASQRFETQTTASLAAAAGDRYELATRDWARRHRVAGHGDARGAPPAGSDMRSTLA